MERSDQNLCWNSLKGDSNVPDLSSIKIENTSDDSYPLDEHLEIIDLIFNRRKKTREPPKEEQICIKKEVDEYKFEKVLDKPKNPLKLKNPLKQVKQISEQIKEAVAVKPKTAVEGRGTFYQVQTRDAAELTLKLSPKAHKKDTMEVEEEDPIKVENTAEVRYKYKNIYWEELSKYKPQLKKKSKK